MGLATYRRKRDFQRTAEPAGAETKRKAAAGKKNRLAFVIQKHDASHLHYDFRLELDGVLKSWAVPKGPSFDPKDKRLAVEVEDHPLEYGSFEGTIPEGEYGGGTVMLWDRGHWTPLGDPHEGYKAGRLKFELHGKKLSGEWMLVRRPPLTSGKPQWLLFKLPDDAAQPKSQFDVTEEEPLSVATGRDLDAIASGRSRVWRSNRDGSEKKSAKRKPAAKTKAARLKKATAAASRAKAVKKKRLKSRLPSGIVPELPTLVRRIPGGDAWIHEIKLDGYRMLAYVDGSDVRLITRNQLDWTDKFPTVARALSQLDVSQALLDGEVVALNEKGISEFQLLQNARAAGNLLYYAFDLLSLDGEDLRPLPLEERKERLRGLGLPTDQGIVRLAEHLEGPGEPILEAAKRQGLEGIVSKRRDRPYISGRTTDWVKTKCQQHAEFVIGGFTDPSGARSGFGALLVGYHEDGKLEYAGKVGTGFNERTLSSLFGQLKSLERDRSPFDGFPAKAKQLRGVHWVEPKLVGQIEFSNWTDDGMLRHPSFQGLREDKPARAVTRETPKALPAASTRHTKSKSSGRRDDKPPAKKGKGSAETSILGVRLTHPDKLLYPADGITKADLAQYYADVAEHMLPHVIGRPLSIVRCPDGIDGERFFQKHPGTMAPKELGRVRIREKAGTDDYLVIEDAKGLVALAQMSALEIHLWGSRSDDVERPDRLVFDLDPAPDVGWKQVIVAAREVRQFLQDLGLESFVKTTGGKGLHLVVPIQRRHEWPLVADFCQRVARAVERAAPQQYVSKMSKQARTGKIFLDYLRNQRGSTAVAPFSTRARPGAPVSTPLTWRELGQVESADAFTIRNIGRRLGRLASDPWKEMAGMRQNLSEKMLRKLE